MTLLTVDNLSCKEYTPTAAELWALNDRDEMARQTNESAFATTWYDQSGSGNTQKTLDLASARAAELGWT